MYTSFLPLRSSLLFFITWWKTIGFYPNIGLGSGWHEATCIALVRLQLVAWSNPRWWRYQHGARFAARQAEDRTGVARQFERIEEGK